MKNSLGLIGYTMLLVFVISIILQFSSRDYLTNFTSETKSSEVPSSSPQENATVRVVENPNGTKTMFVYSSLNVKLSIGVRGQFFDSGKYEKYKMSITIQEKHSIS